MEFFTIFNVWAVFDDLIDMGVSAHTIWGLLCITHNGNLRNWVELQLILTLDFSTSEIS